MPPKRGRPRAPQHPVAQSDYDTDTAYLTDVNHDQSHPPIRTNEELNLSVLQRHNSAVNQILSIAPFAVVYLFSPETQQWEKCGIEGTLFVCQLLPETIPDNPVVVERYSVVVLNRKGLENFSTELLSGSDVEITEQYVILQITAEDGTPQIFGLWIFSEPEPASTAQSRIINAQIIQECASRAENSRILAGQDDGPDVPYDEKEEDEEEGEMEEEEEDPAAMHESIKVPLSVGQQINMDNLFAQRQSNGHHQQPQRFTDQDYMPQQYPPYPPQQPQSHQQPQFQQFHQQQLHQNHEQYPQQFYQQPHQQPQQFPPQYQPPQPTFGMPQVNRQSSTGPSNNSQVLLGLFKNTK